MTQPPRAQTPLRLKLVSDSLVSCLEPGAARNENCLICMEPWDSGNGNKHQLILHLPCRNFLHERCFTEWYAHCETQDILARCPLCTRIIPMPGLIAWRALHREARSLQLDVQFQEQRLSWEFDDIHSDIMALIHQAKPVSLAGVRQADLDISIHIISTSLHNLLKVRVHSQYVRVLRLTAAHLFHIAERSISRIIEHNPHRARTAHTLVTNHLFQEFTHRINEMINSISGPDKDPILAASLQQWWNTCISQERSYHYGVIDIHSALALTRAFNTWAATTVRNLIASLDAAISTAITDLSISWSVSGFRSNRGVRYQDLHDNYNRHMSRLREIFINEASADRRDNRAWRQGIVTMTADMLRYRNTGRISSVRRRMINRSLGQIMSGNGYRR